MNTLHDAAAALDVLKRFVNPSQLSVMADNCHGEEGQFFIDKLAEMSALVQTMPTTYAQSEVADPVAHLHYFLGSADWYITERDVEADQLQAFGSANLGYGAELGYIPIEELIANNVDLDLFFTPQPLSQLEKAN